MTTTPPRLAAALLEFRVPSSEYEFIVGDLEERFQETARRLGDSAARRWYWGAVLSLSVRRWPTIPALHPLPKGDGAMVEWLRDLRLGTRVLRRAPLFSALVVLTFAIGLGSTGAIFSVLDPVLLRGAPYPGADRLLMLFGKEKDGASSNVGFLTFRDVEARSRSLSQVAVMSYWTPVLRGSDESERLNAQRVSHRFFATLGAAPELGRDFRPEEDHAATRGVVILSHDLWQRRFAGDPGIIGRSITLTDRPVTVIGVMPKQFESLLAPEAELWGPIGYEDTDPWACRSCQHLRMIGRVADGITLPEARAELDRISATMVAEHPDDYAMAGLVTPSLNSYLTRNVQAVLLATAGAVALLLLIACVNVVNLFLGRAARRSGEFAVRSALGAGAGQVVRQVLAEAVVLALAGGALAVLLAFAAVKGILAFAPDRVPRLDQVAVNLDVLGFTLLLATVAGLLAGTAPALAALRSNVAGLIRQGGRTIARSGRRVRTTLVIVEVALALMLLVGAGLLVRSLGRLLSVDPGFDPSGLVTLELEPFGARYDSLAAINRFYQAVAGRVSTIPGVTAVSATTQLPLSGDFDSWGVHLEAHPSANPAEDPSAFRFGVTPGYLKAMRIPLIRGRDLEPRDDATRPPVLLVSQTMASRLFPTEDPLGQRIRIGGPDGPWRTIVGITGDVRHTSLDADPEFEMYVPTSQAPYAETRMVLVVRANGEAAQLVPQVRQVIREIDPGVPVATVATMAEHIRSRSAVRRFALMVFQAFGGVALLLAGLGIYGVLATGVTERSREIGIRSALGASREVLVGSVVRQAMTITLVGMAVGIGGALALTGLLRSLLFGISPSDPVTFGVVGMLLLTVALAAAGVPAWRAAKTDPAVVLREE